MKPGSTHSTLILLALFCIHALPSAAQYAEWTMGISGSSTDFIHCIDQDQLGNIYVGGALSPGGGVAGQPFGIQGSGDGFLAKFNAQGQYLWHERAGGSQNTGTIQDHVRFVYVDTLVGAVYFCGGLSSSTLSSIGACETLSTPGGFLAKYDLNGQCVWVRAVHQGGMNRISLAGNGDVIVSGGSSSPMTPAIEFQGDPPVTLPPGPYMARYSSNGDLIWAKHMGSGIAGVGMAHQDTVFYHGTFDTTSDADLLGTELMGHPDHSVSFIAAIGPDLDTVYGYHQFHSTGLLSISRILMTGEAIIFTGVFDGDFYFFDDTLSSAIRNVYVALMHRSGTGIMSVPIHSPELIVASNIALTVDGDILLSVLFLQEVTIDIHTWTSSHPQGDFLLVKMTQDGTILSAMNYGPAFGRTFPLEANDGGVLLATRSQGDLDLGNITHTGPANNQSIVLMKFNMPTSMALPKFNTQGRLLIYANPNAGTCTIELPQELSRERDLWLRIYDGQGRLVQQSSLRMEQDVIKLDITAQARGTYLAEVGNGRVKYTGAIIFE
jgi:hypothetical protein